MSWVTDIILATTIEDGAERDETYPNVDILNHYLIDHHKGSKLLKVDEYSGGSKAMQCDVFMAAINYLNTPSFLEHFYKIKWEYLESVQLMLKDEQDESFAI